MVHRPGAYMVNTFYTDMVLRHGAYMVHTFYTDMVHRPGQGHIEIDKTY